MDCKVPFVLFKSPGCIPSVFGVICIEVDPIDWMGWVLKSDKYVCPLKKFTLLIALFHEKPTVLWWHWGQDGPMNVPLQTEGIVRGQQFWENGGEMLLAQLLINAKMQSKCKIPDESKWESPRQVPLGLAPDRKSVQAFRFQGAHLNGVNYEVIDHGQ